MRDGVWNHQPCGCLLKRLFRPRSKKTPKLRVTVGRWIPSTKGQLRGKCLHLMTSSWKSLVAAKYIPWYMCTVLTYIVRSKLYWCHLNCMWNHVNTLRPRQNGRHYQKSFAYDIIEVSAIIGSGKGLVPTKRPSITCTIDGWIIDAYMRHAASMSWWCSHRVETILWLA